MEYIDIALHHNLITFQNNIIQATDLGLAWVSGENIPVEKAMIGFRLK